MNDSYNEDRSRLEGDTNWNQVATNLGYKEGGCIDGITGQDLIKKQQNHTQHSSSVDELYAANPNVIVRDDEGNVIANVAEGAQWVTVFSGTIENMQSHQVRYDRFVMMLLKQQSPELMKAHCGMGVCGEAGELADAIKREVNYGHNKTFEGKSIRDAVIEECGDLRFYIQATMNLYGISEREVLQGNANKLGKRYVGLVYSDSAAQNRADKTGINGVQA